MGEYIRPESLVHGLCVVADLNDVEVEVDVARARSFAGEGRPMRAASPPEAHANTNLPAASLAFCRSRAVNAVQFSCV